MNETSSRSTALLSTAGLLVFTGAAIAGAPALRLEPRDLEPGEHFGLGAALDGDTAVVGAYWDDDNGPQSGSAYVFERREDGSWPQAAKLLAPDGAPDDFFGREVSTSDDVVLASSWADDDLGESSGSAWIFERRDDGTWQPAVKLLAPDGVEGDQFGSAVVVVGDTAFVGAGSADPLGSSSGAVYVFERQPDGTWPEVAKLTASDGSPNDQFGSRLDFDGDTLVVGAVYHDHVDPWAGAAYVFERDGTGAWRETAELLNPRAAPGITTTFGDVAVHGETILFGGTAGPIFEDEEAAWVFERVSGAWEPVQELRPADAGYRDFFGEDIALGDGVALFGGLSADGLLEDQGTAWIFSRGGDETWQEVGELTPPAPSEDGFFGAALDLSGDRFVIGAYGTDDFTGAAWLYSGQACALAVRAPEVVRPGDEIAIEVALDHNRLRTVTVPLALWVEAGDGTVVAELRSAPLTVHHGDSLRRSLDLRLPADLPPGEYRVSVGVARMQQGVAAAWTTFRVVGSPGAPWRPAASADKGR